MPATGRKARPPVMRKSLKKSLEATVLRPSLAKRMKSRQSSAALAIFQKARRTAAIAAKVAADAAAFVSSANYQPKSVRRFPGGMFGLLIFLS